MNVTWYGTASVEISDGETKLLFDPFVRQNKKIKKPTIEDFVGADAIFITHGHFDHLYSVPELLKKDKNVPVYCTKTPAHTLEKNQVDKSRINIINADDTVKIKGFTVKAIKAKHIIFDPIYILSVVPKCAFALPTGIKLAVYNRKMPLNNDIVMYDIENNGKHILLSGSFGYYKDVEYPKNPDMFILANGGSVFVPDITKDFIDMIKPKCVFVDHFDDAFPPVTRKVSVKRLTRTIIRNHPETKVIIPEEFVSVTV